MAGGCMVGGGVHEAGGTHPSGMHSCYYLVSHCIPVWGTEPPGVKFLHSLSCFCVIG